MASAVFSNQHHFSFSSYTYRAAFKTTVILVPLLGVTWLLGFISIHDKSLTFQYLFAVVNSTQVWKFWVFTSLQILRNYIQISSGYEQTHAVIGAPPRRSGNVLDVKVIKITLALKIMVPYDNWVEKIELLRSLLTPSIGSPTQM